MKALSSLISKRHSAPEPAAEDLKARLSLLFCKHLEISPGKDKGFADRKALAEAVLALAHLAAEVKTTCPRHASGQAWFELDRLLFALAKDTVCQIPAAEAGGTALYEQFGALLDESAAGNTPKAAPAAA